MSTSLPESDYWSASRRPLACLVFLLPLLLMYEAGVLLLGAGESPALRNGADYWMRAGLRACGLNQTLLLPGLIVAVLLAWQFWGRHPWTISRETLAGMAAESLLFAFVLVVLGQVQDLMFQRWLLLAIGPAEARRVFAQMVSFVGAGVYEEVMFRLGLLPLLFALLRALALAPRWAGLTAIVLSSLVFSAAHHVGPAAEELTAFGFLFRALAGVFFAALFMTRGFGITVGTHAAYDMLVGLLLALQR